MNTRAIDIGAVLSRVFRIYGEQWAALIPSAAIVFGTTGVINVALESGSSGLIPISAIVALVGNYIFTGVIVELVADVQDDRLDATVPKLFAAVMPVLGKLILVGIVTAILVGIGFLLLVIPGLILVTIWAVVAPVVVLERPGGLGALGRSTELVRGNGWRVFAVIFVLYALVGVITVVVDSLFGFKGSALQVAVVSVVAVFTAPLQSLGAAVLYFDLRGARSAAPVEVASALGPGYPPPPPTDPAAAAPSETPQSPDAAPEPPDAAPQSPQPRPAPPQPPPGSPAS